MSTIRVEENHGLSVDDAKRALESFGEDIAKWGMKLHWNGTNADIKGTGASGDVKVSASSVVVTVKLGLIAKAAGVKADRLEKSITRRLKTALTGSES